MSKLLEYSLWHRTLGFGFYAMDIDSIEIRDGIPVALIEASICTSGYPSCSGKNGVFNRFLRETGGFQIELAWWVARWLEIPAFVTCIGDSSNQISVLSLTNGQMINLSENEYINFIDNIGSTQAYKTLTVDPLQLNELLELLSVLFPGLVSAYPYFKNKEKWLLEYDTKLNGIRRRNRRNRPDDVNVPNDIRVKGETTNARPSDYLAIRSKSKQKYVNIEWVEWRKDRSSDFIGRPAALIRTSQVSSCCSLKEHSERAEDEFKSTDEYSYWVYLADKMLIPFYSVHFSFEKNIFYVFKYDNNDTRSRIMNLEEYKHFVCSI